MELSQPVVFGDTLRVETEALDKRESKSRPEAGIVGIEHRGYNRDNELVCVVVRRTALMLRRADQAAEVVFANAL